MKLHKKNLRNLEYIPKSKLKRFAEGGVRIKKK